MYDFANRLKQLRLSREITQKQLGNILNVTQNAVFNWETGKTQPTWEMIEQIANYFSVSPSYLMGWEDRTTIAQILSQNVKRYREKLNISLTALAEHANVSPEYICKIESGHVTPTPSELTRIADGLIVSVEQLLSIPNPTPEENKNNYICDILRQNGYTIFNVLANNETLYWIVKGNSFYEVDTETFDLFVYSIDDYVLFNFEKMLSKFKSKEFKPKA